MRFILFSILAVAGTALARPSNWPKRQSATTCGSNQYSSSQLSAALNKGYSLYEDGETLGEDEYPHAFQNYSGFTFSVDGPYQEFPVQESGVYTGGSPGADRVIFNDDGEYAGAITHTGAPGDDFVGCSGTS